MPCTSCIVRLFVTSPFRCAAPCCSPLHRIAPARPAALQSGWYRPCGGGGLPPSAHDDRLELNAGPSATRGAGAAENPSARSLLRWSTLRSLPRSGRSRETRMRRFLWLRIELPKLPTASGSTSRKSPTVVCVAEFAVVTCRISSSRFLHPAPAPSGQRLIRLRVRAATRSPSCPTSVRGSQDPGPTRAGCGRPRVLIWVRLS